MIRLTSASLLAVCLLGPLAARAQDAPRFRWQVGQVLNYKIEHATTYFEKVGEAKSETKSIVKTAKRWQVTAVDAHGTATVQLSLTALAQERTTSSGDVLKYDSADPDKSTPEMKAAMAQYLNTTLAVLRVDAYGRVAEVKESKTPATAYEVELPFLLLLPAALPKAGQGWERAYKITLTPPLGTGEKYDAAQKYTCKEVKGDRMTVAVKTELKTALKAPADGIPLWQMMPEGEVVFDLKAGRLHGATLGVTRELKNHQGENSEVKFTSSLKVEIVEK
jgi:hypothetical protein